MASITYSYLLHALMLVVTTSVVLVAAQRENDIEFDAAAIAKLPGMNLSRLASQYSLTKASLMTILETNKDLGLDTRSNKLVYACSFQRADSANVRRRLQHDHHHTHSSHTQQIQTPSQLHTVEVGLEPQSSSRGLLQLIQANLDDPNPLTVPVTSTGVPKLHSRPRATRKIYLDFDGHVTSNTLWNVGNFTRVTTPAYSRDADTSRFSADEKSDIIAIWRAVSEDYAAFDVDVTTEDPGTAGLIRTDDKDASYGVRVCIGGSSADWYCGSVNDVAACAGGVAYMTSFGWDSDTPVFIFPHQLGPFVAKFVWEAVSHEVGHALGLFHDGHAGGEYYEGRGDWAPIMGVGFYRQITQFSKGDYNAATQQQDDLAVIASYVAPLADDHGSSIASATNITSGVSVTGMIGYNDAADVFRFTAGAGPLSATAEVLPPWAGSYSRSNLDVLLTLSNAKGGRLTSANPAGEGSVQASLPASLTYSITSPGVYYLSVARTGYGNAATGYSDYGSMGQYVLTARFNPPRLSPSPSPSPSASPRVSPSPSPRIPSSPSPSPSPSRLPSPSPPVLSLQAPVLQNVTAFANRTALLLWLDHSSSEAWFQVQRCRGAGCSAFGSVASAGSSSTAGSGQQYRYWDAVKGDGSGTYCYRLLACNSSNACGAPSNHVCVAMA